MDYMIFIAGIILLLSLLSIGLSEKLRIPLIAMFLFVGMLAGSESFGGIHFDNAEITQQIGTLALIFILFSGGLETKISDARSVLAPSVVLATLGVLLTALITAVFIYYLTNLGIKESLLFGAIVSSTDAAAVMSIFGDSKLKKKIKTLIIVESGSNDPMAYTLILLILSIFKNNDYSALGSIVFLIKQLFLGGLLGYIFGKIAVPISKILKIKKEEYLTLNFVALLLICYSITSVIEGNSFLAVYIMGIIISADVFSNKTSSLRSFRLLSVMWQISMFVILGLLVFPSQLIQFVVTGSLLAILITIVGRLIVVFTLLFPFKYNWREKFFISWAGLKGAVPIIFATYVITEDLDNSQSIFNLVFYIVIFSVIIQGIPLKWLGRSLNLFDKQKDDEEIDFEDLEDLSLKKINVDEDYEYVNKNISEIVLPDDVFIVAIERNGKYLSLRLSTIIKDGDVLLLASKNDLENTPS